MVALEVHAQRRIVRIVAVGAVRIAEVTVEVLAPQMLVQFVAIEEAHVTVLAQRMAAVRRVVDVALAPVEGELGAIVAAPLE